MEEARRQWEAHGWGDAAPGMAVVTSVMRVQQIFLARVDAVLRPLGLTFARFELLTLLAFSREGRLPMSRAGARLQVHPTSVTNAVDRLEGQGYVRRLAHDSDRRTTLVELTDDGRFAQARAASALNRETFTELGLDADEASTLVDILRGVRVGAGDFPA